MQGSPSHRVAEITGSWWLGNLFEYRRDPLAFVRKAAGEGDLVRVRLGDRTLHFCFHPEQVHHVLVEKAQSYGKQTRGFQMLRLILGDGLLTSEGAFWKRQRRIAQPEFTRDRVDSYESIMREEAEALLERWEPYLDTDKPLDVEREMMRLALRIVCRALLGSEIGERAEAVDAALTEVLGQAVGRATALFNPPLSWPTPGNRRFRQAAEALDRIVYGFIERRRRGEGDGSNLLSRLMAARDEETGEAMDDRQLRDEVMTMFLAGHETTANALAWTWCLLAQHPAAREKLEASLPDERYATLVVKESMRLYPPAWIFGRSATEPDEIEGVPIPAGGQVFIVPFVTHRHAGFWNEPERFVPERFEVEKLAHRWAYLPFGAGPRQCIGKDFALRETLLVLTTIAKRVRLDLVPGHPVEPRALVTLRPRHGLKMFARRRS